MIRLATLSLLLVTAHPVMAQIAAPSGQQTSGTTGSTQSSAQGGASSAGLDATCNELIAGTFCTSGRSGGSGYGSFSAGTSASDPSLPSCASGTPANELCN